jgi:hypothetical protein
MKKTLYITNQSLLLKAAHLYGKSCTHPTLFLLNEIAESNKWWMYMDLCTYIAQMAWEQSKAYRTTNNERYNGSVLYTAVRKTLRITCDISGLSPFLRAFAKLWKATVSFVMTVRLSARSNSASSGIFMQFYNGVFFGNLSRKFKFH